MHATANTMPRLRGTVQTTGRDTVYTVYPASSVLLPSYPEHREGCRAERSCTPSRVSHQSVRSGRSQAWSRCHPHTDVWRPRLGRHRRQRTSTLEQAWSRSRHSAWHRLQVQQDIWLQPPLLGIRPGRIVHRMRPNQVVYMTVRRPCLRGQRC